MLVNDNDALARLNSPANLLNRLREVSNKKTNEKGQKGLSIFQPGGERESESSSQSPSIDSLVNDSEDKIKLATAHNTALDVVNSAIGELSSRLHEIKAEKLPSVIIAASKVVEGIRKERSEAQKARGNNSVNFHFYVPEQKTLNDYEVIEVNRVG